MFNFANLKKMPRLAKSAPEAMESFNASDKPGAIQRDL